MGLVADAKAEKYNQSEELITAIYIEKIGVGKIVAYKGNNIWELTVGDPYVPEGELLDLFPTDKPSPPAQFVSELRRIVSMMRNMGSNMAAVVTEKTKDVRVHCPGDKINPFGDHYQCGGPVDTISGTVIHLNDQHKWSREAIADWLDTLDNQPVFYPSEELRTTNSANMVACQPVVSKESDK